MNLGILLGKMDRTTLKKYIIIQAIAVWFFILVAYLLYPPSNFSILECTFSYLGSFDPDRNVHGWYFFSIALFLMGIFFIPIELYRSRRVTPIESLSGKLITLIYLIGCIGVILVGVFPDTGVDFFQDVGNRKMHNLVSLLGFGGFLLGVLWESLLMGKDRYPHWLFSKGKGGRKLLDHSKLQYPYIFFYILAILVGIFVGGWEIVYPIMRAQDPYLSHWPGVGIFSFPLWEWMLIIYVFVFFYSTALLLPETPPKK
jgi:hypothetical membrane protein